MYNNFPFFPTLKRLLIYSSPWKKMLLFSVTALWISAISEACGPLLVSYFIDKMVAKKYLPINLVVGLTILYVFLQLLSASLHYIQFLLFNQSAIRIIQQLRIDVMDKALRQPLSEFDAHPVGQIISRITNDTEVIRDFYVIVLPTILNSVALIISTLLAMFILDWRMASITMTIFPLVFIVMWIYQYYSTPIVRRVRAYLADIHDGFNEIINGMHVIQQFRQQARFGEKIGKINRSHYLARMQTLRLDGFLLRPLISLLSTLLLCALLFLFSYNSVGIIEVGVLYAFISYLGRLNEPLIELITRQSILQQALVAGERVFELMDKSIQKYGNDNREIKKGSIIFKDVYFSYQNQYPVLLGINFTASPGSFIAIVGHTGSGKSTIASLLMGFYPLKQGEIYIDGRPISSISHSVLRKSISVVQQDPIIIADTIYTNIALGRDFTKNQVWEILKKVQLDSLVKKMSNGINTILSEHGSNLSVGQKQLLSLARVLIEKPRILILDEATSSIDSYIEKSILKNLSEIRENITLVAIAHRLSTVIDADNIIVLNRGQLIESGTHKQLIAAKGYYWKMYQLQLAEEDLASCVPNKSSF